MEAVKPCSRRPKTIPIATADRVRERVIELRAQLRTDGLDAGRRRSGRAHCRPTLATSGRRPARS
jgi:hypothetical protein